MLRFVMKNLPSWLFLFASAVAVGGEDKPEGRTAKAAPNPQQETSVWMKKKLDYTQQILSGIATADFDQITAAAEHLRTLGKIEGFIRNRTPAYRTQLQLFQESNEELIQQAQSKNVEGAALAFTQLTFTCIHCHKHLRAQADK